MITVTAETSKIRRIDLILHQIDSLPTLPVVATRLLAMTSNDASSARDVIELIRNDPALTAKVLSLCRKAATGIRESMLSVERAVVLLGFNAIRNAVLSVKVFETLGGGVKGSKEGADRFDRREFWRHSLAVALCAEGIAQIHRRREDLDAGDAFVCGLLHDIGKLALDMVLPKAFGRVLELAELNQGNMADFERRIIGIDHHTAGKRLAEQWQLQHVLQDCIWLHGSSYELLPKLDHRPMIGLVSLADVLVRRHHLGYSGNFSFHQNPEALISALGLDAGKVDEVVTSLHEQLHQRGELLGLEDQPSEALFLQSIRQANEALGRLNAVLDRRSRVAADHHRALEAISAFHSTARPGESVQQVACRVVSTMAEVFGEGFYSLLYRGGDGGPWVLYQFSREGQFQKADYIDVGPGVVDLGSLGSEQSVSMDVMGLMPWVADYLVTAVDLRKVRLLPLACGWGTVAVLLLLHDRSSLGGRTDVSALVSTWGSAIAAAGQHEGARELGEELAATNRALAEAQEKLLRSATMARLGEMAAGAAHEMNNPLAVISGRSQMLAKSLPSGTAEQQAAHGIVEQSHRLSDLITGLRMFADPAKADRRETDLAVLLNQVVGQIQAEMPEYQKDTPLSVKVDAGGQRVWIDPQQIGGAVRELIVNAVQAKPKSSVHVAARVDVRGDVLTIQVSDDGIGMDSEVLSHAKDPFYSFKAAGRRTGLGLARAEQWVAAHGGELHLNSTPQRGTVATLVVPLGEGGLEVDAEESS